MRRKLVAGNWKMHTTRVVGQSLVGAFDAAQVIRATGNMAGSTIDIAILPPAVYLADLISRFKNSRLIFGAQDVSAHANGAYTGEIAASMFKDIGASHTLVGHSERRLHHSDSNECVAAKFVQAQAAGLIPILCVGESLSEREHKATETIIAAQIDAVIARCSITSLHNAIVAYEPVWAIGTGRTASPAQAQEVHAFIRDKISKFDAIIGGSLRILYGGSVKPANAAELFAQPDIDGGLIGGAALIAEDFLAICAAAQAA